MKNITEILTALGIQIPEDKKADFDKEFAENYKTVADYNKQKLKLEQAQESLQLAQEGLEKFDGVDVAALQNQITTLQNDMAAKETAHAKELADRDFADTLNSAIRKRGGRSEKAIWAMLDVDALKASKNQADDIAAALDANVQANPWAYQTKDDEDNNLDNTMRVDTGAEHGEGGNSDADGVTAAFAALNPGLTL